MKDLIKRSREHGMQTFDQHLFDLYESGQISFEEGLRNADSVNDLRIAIKLNSKRGRTRDLLGETDSMSMREEDAAHGSGMMLR